LLQHCSVLSDLQRIELESSRESTGQRPGVLASETGDSDQVNEICVDSVESPIDHQDFGEDLIPVQSVEELDDDGVPELVETDGESSHGFGVHRCHDHTGDLGSVRTQHDD
jgi:hypothetical protein